MDLENIIGLENAKRALEVAAVAGHSIVLIGRSGIGKKTLMDAFYDMDNGSTTIVHDIYTSDTDKYDPIEYLITNECKLNILNIKYDIHVECVNPNIDTVNFNTKYESTTIVKTRISDAQQILQYVQKTLTDTASKTLVKTAINKLNLPIGRYFKIIDVARSIAALSKSKVILAEHIAEAIQYNYLYTTD